jgi:acyl-CoA synthetase (AMP-forming)/AMP-acid ligase II
MSKRDKVLLGVAGATGASVVAWRTLFPWIGHDLKLMKVGLKFKKSFKEAVEKEHKLIDIFENHVSTQPRKPFLIFEDRIYTYEFVNQQANRVANIALQWKLNAGDVVAILIYNEPAFVWTFLGKILNFKVELLSIKCAYFVHNSAVKSRSYVPCVTDCEGQHKS